MPRRTRAGAVIALVVVVLVVVVARGVELARVGAGVETMTTRTTRTMTMGMSTTRATRRDAEARGEIAADAEDDARAIDAGSGGAGEEETAGETRAERDETAGETPAADAETDEDDGYVSVGKIRKTGLLNAMDLEEGDNLLVAAKMRAHRKELILLNANAGGVVLTANAVSAMRKVGIEHFIVYTESEKTCREGFIDAGGRDIDCAWTSYLQKHPRLGMFGVAGDTGADAFRLWWSRMEYMWRLSGAGYNVMYVDTDVSFRVNPYPALKNVLGDMHVLAQGEFQGVLGLNIGFMYIQNAAENGIARGIFGECVARMLMVLESEPPLRKWNGEIAGGAKESMWDQHIFNDVVASAVVGHFINPRQGARVIEPEKRQEWTESQGFPSSHDLDWQIKRVEVPLELLPAKFTSDESFASKFNRGHSEGFQVHYRKLKNLSNRTDADEFVAIAPFWLLDGWTGAGWSPKTQGAHNAWLGDSPVMMAHFVGGLDKSLEMKALGWWDYAADAYASRSSLDTNETHSRFVAVEGLRISGKDSHEALYRVKLEVFKLAKIGMITHRRVIAPAFSCNESFIEKKENAEFGVWSQNNFVLTDRCWVPSERDELCCVPKHLSCPGLVVQSVEFHDDAAYSDFRGDGERETVNLSKIVGDGKKLTMAALQKSRLNSDASVVVLKLSDVDVLPEIEDADEDYARAITTERACQRGLARKESSEFEYPW